MALSYGSSGIACAAYAAAWGKPPTVCEDAESRCDIKPLTATMALAAVSDSYSIWLLILLLFGSRILYTNAFLQVFSFIEAAVLICVAVIIILTIMKSRRAA